jgi:molybdenum cofactor cytidylyltransferase
MPFDTAKIGLILLAAGSSRRMDGEPKQLLKFRGKTLLRRASEVAIQSKNFPVIAVLAKDSENLKTEIADLPVEAVFNIYSTVGIASSIKRV